MVSIDKSNFSFLHLIIVLVMYLNEGKIFHGNVLIVYKYYIPESAIVGMFILRKALSTEAKPSLIIIFKG